MQRVRSTYLPTNYMFVAGPVTYVPFVYILSYIIFLEQVCRVLYDVRCLYKII